MTSMDQERWLRVKDRLRIEVGEDIYLSWFARMELDVVEPETIKLSVPTRFLKSWIQSHYAERLLGCWQSEQPTTMRIELTVRSAAIRPLQPKIKLADPVPVRETKLNGHEPRGLMPPISAVHEGLGGSPLEPARPCGGPAGGTRPPRRRRHVQSALHSCRRGARQDASAASGGVGRQCRPRAQGAVS